MNFFKKELANENLLFWREGIKYKRSFDQKGDFDYAQQMAKVRTSYMLLASLEN